MMKGIELKVIGELTPEAIAKINKQKENKKKRLNQMREDFDNGKMDEEIIKSSTLTQTDLNNIRLNNKK